MSKKRPSKGKGKQKRSKRVVPVGVVRILATFNNTTVTVTDSAGAVLCWSSAGKLGFKGTRRGTPFAGQQTGENAAKKAMEEFGMKTVSVFVKGPGPARETATRAIAAVGLSITSLGDTTPIPHNGCKAPKRRRV